MSQKSDSFQHFPNDLDFNGTSVLITGGTGSFGQALVERMLTVYKPDRLIIFSRDELKQYEMEQRFDGPEASRLRYFIGDVRDVDRLHMALRGVEYVIHAAALKHVPTAEYNPFECIHTNVIGAENVVQAAIRSDVRRVIALSTDKAVNPVNLYGASKLASDKIFVAANHLSGADGPRFSVVRYGNVLGSRGSVIPLFLRLMRSGATQLPVTDARMTRFWITLDQGVEFVLSCLERMRGGEVFVPKIPSMSVVDVATGVAPHLPQHEIGIRPGEKLHEVLITEDDARFTSEFPDRFVIEPSVHKWASNRDALPGAAPVAADFRYASDSNDWWLSAKELREHMAPLLA